MNRIEINTSGRKSLLLMGGSIDAVSSLIPARGLFIITDTNIKRHYGALFPQGEVLIIEPGERSKSLEVVGELCSKMLEMGADRSSFILGIGGGVVCDIAGLTASLYMRGVRHAFISTTLLSQVDASIGGKTGVNLGIYKNIIGTFRQPEFVLCDYNMLATLPEEELLSGMGELLKYAAIGNRELFFDIAASLSAISEGDIPLLGELIHRAVMIKAEVVRRDPLEKNLRRILNFGHTFGHLIETHYHIPHGVAVSHGMIIAAELSLWKGVLPREEYYILKETLEKAGMSPVYRLPAGTESLLKRDKKSEGGVLNFVMLESVGKAVVKRVTSEEMLAFVTYYNNIR